MYGTPAKHVFDKYETKAKPIRSRFEAGALPVESKGKQLEGNQKPCSLQRIMVPCLEPVIIEQRKRLLHKKLMGGLGL